MNPGGLPLFERTSNQSPLEVTTVTRVPCGMLATVLADADGSS